MYLGLVNDETLILLFKNVHRLSDDTTVGFGFIFKHTKGGPSATTGGKNINEAAFTLGMFS